MCNPNTCIYLDPHPWDFNLHILTLFSSALAYLDDGVWDAHLPAEGWQPDDELERVDVVGDHDLHKEGADRYRSQDSVRRSG